LLVGDPADLPALAVIKAATTKAAADSIAQQEISSVEPWRAHIVPMVDRGAGPRAIRDCLKLLHKEFTCSESAVKRFVARLRRERGITVADVVIPVETGPGEVAQVDFGYVGKIYDQSVGHRRKTWVFVMTFGLSRRLFVRFVHDQRATIHLLFVELGDRLLRVVIGCHLDESEAAGPARRHVPHHPDGFHLADPAKQLGKLVLRG